VLIQYFGRLEVKQEALRTYLQHAAGSLLPGKLWYHLRIILSVWRLLLSYIQAVPFKTHHNKSRSTMQKWNQKQVHPRTSIIDCPNLPRDTRLKVILVTRPLLTLVAQKMRSCAEETSAIVACLERIVPAKWIICDKRERQNSWNYGRTNFEQCISCNSGMQLQ
jgi:hypothetical protein